MSVRFERLLQQHIDADRGGFTGAGLRFDEKASAFIVDDVKIEFAFVEDYQLTIFCNGKAAAQIGIAGRDSFVGAYIHTPTAEATGIASEGERNQLKAKVYQVMQRCNKDGIPAEKISQLAGLVKDRRRAAYGGFMPFISDEECVPIAQTLWMVMTALKEILVPFITSNASHLAEAVRGGQSPEHPSAFGR